MTGGFQDVLGLASNTTIFSGSLEFVQGPGVSESTTIENGGAEIVESGTASDSTIESGGLLVVLPGASVTGTALLAGGSSVSSGVVIVGGTVPFYAASLATSLTASGETSYILQGGTAGSITISGGSEFVYAGGMIFSNALDNYARTYIETGGTSIDGQIGNATEVIESGGISDDDTVLGQGMLIVDGTATNAVVQAGGTLTGGSVDDVTLDGGYASISSLMGTAVLGSDAFLFSALPVSASISFAGTNAELLLPEESPNPGDLDGLQIGGFSATDTVVLGGFNFTSESFVAGAGLELSNGMVSETLDILGNLSIDGFVITNPGDATVIEVVCYLRGTRIATPAGEIPVEALKIGDAVITRFGGYQRIKWIGRQSFGRRFVEKNNFEQIPVRIAAGALGAGVPRRDLFVSPGHSMLIEGVLVLAAALVNGVTITQGWAPEVIHYYQIEFETHDCVLAEGAWSESYADTPDFRGKFHNVTEFYALYPEHQEPETQVLCAPRPLEGPALAAVLRPLVQRVAAEPGRLHGYIDEVSGGRVRGWAWDEANPQLPVQLEILLRSRIIGRVLACDYRRDLEDAGFGRGRCGFEFFSGLGLPGDAARDLRVGRAETPAAWVSLALSPSYGLNPSDGLPYFGRCMSNRLSGVMRA